MCAVGIALSGAGQRMINQCAIRADDGCLYAIDRTFIVRPQRESLELLGSQQPLIGVPTLNSRGVGTLAVVTVIDDGSNWYARNEVRQTA